MPPEDEFPRASIQGHSGGSGGNHIHMGDVFPSMPRQMGKNQFYAQGGGGGGGRGYPGQRAPLHVRMHEDELRHNLERIGENEPIMWLVQGRYTYVAVKVRGKWYTTATEDNTYFDCIMSSKSLTEAMIRNDCTDLGFFDPRDLRYI